MAEFIDATGTEAIVHIPDRTGELWDRFGIRRQSAYVFVNDDGTWEKKGYGNLVSDVEALLAK